jgi:hypothetical protein
MVARPARSSSRSNPRRSARKASEAAPSWVGLAQTCVDANVGVQGALSIKGTIKGTIKRAIKGP